MVDVKHGDRVREPSLTPRIVSLGGRGSAVATDGSVGINRGHRILLGGRRRWGRTAARIVADGIRISASDSPTRARNTRLILTLVGSVLDEEK